MSEQINEKKTGVSAPIQSHADHTLSQKKECDLVMLA